MSTDTRQTRWRLNTRGPRIDGRRNSATLLSETCATAAANECAARARGRFTERLPESGGEVAVARIPEVQCEPREIALALFEPLECSAQTDLLAVFVKRLSGRAPERSAEMKHRAADAARDTRERQALRESCGDESLCRLGELHRAHVFDRPPANGRQPVRIVQHPIEQRDDALFGGEAIERARVG